MKTILVSIIIPCLNEERAIGGVVHSARSLKEEKFKGLKVKLEIIERNKRFHC
ncbi:hypothetical protein HY030_02265 [Candidatus Gottesmanbacteria bacterium]|nr:hypothetical protein [Candidatus Gottesmanbacteria bacterium]